MKAKPIHIEYYKISHYYVPLFPMKSSMKSCTCWLGLWLSHCLCAFPVRVVLTFLTGTQACWMWASDSVCTLTHSCLWYYWTRYHISVRVWSDHWDYGGGGVYSPGNITMIFNIHSGNLQLSMTRMRQESDQLPPAKVKTLSVKELLHGAIGYILCLKITFLGYLQKHKYCVGHVVLCCGSGESKVQVLTFTCGHEALKRVQKNNAVHMSGQN